METQVFEGSTDRYGGVTVVLKQQLDLVEHGRFEANLEASLERWSLDGVRGVWFRVDITCSEHVAVLVRHSFVYHHAGNGSVTLLRWLPRDEPCIIPPYAHTTVGVGGLVISDCHQQLLVVREKYFQQPHWKLPGGYVEPGEDLGAAAVREVLEETGVRAEFMSLSSFRHQHGMAHGCSDLYFICRLRPLSRDINMCTRELTDCRWMPISEYMTHPDVSRLNRGFVTAFLEERGRGGGGLRAEAVQLPGRDRQLHVFSPAAADDEQPVTAIETAPPVSAGSTQNNHKL